MGGDKVFIKMDEEDFRELIKESQSFFQQWFSVVREWKPSNVRGARYTWCCVYGLPIHAWRRNIFSVLTVFLVV